MASAFLIDREDDCPYCRPPRGFRHAGLRPRAVRALLSHVDAIGGGEHNPGAALGIDGEAGIPQTGLAGLDSFAPPIGRGPVPVYPVHGQPVDVALAIGHELVDEPHLLVQQSGQLHVLPPSSK